MTKLVTAAIQDNIGWITINNPPVNATSTEVRVGLLKAVNSVKNCQLAVLQCEGKTFVAGGDMSEFYAPPAEPHLPDVVNAIEKSPAPFLALLHGNVLGGGFEIAMACAFRVAKPGTRFGLPEVNVGLIPGAGGSQRVPRLLGWPMAIDMACLGQLKTAETLLAVGGIDAICDDFHSVVNGFVGKPFQRGSERVIVLPDAQTLKDYKVKIDRTAKGKQSPYHNFRALQWSIEPFSKAQPKERALHLDLRQSSESRALRHVFFAERAVARPAIIRDVKPFFLQSIAIIGGGLMGSGIAAACLNAGYKVGIIERDELAVEKAKVRVETLLKGALGRGKITNAQFQTQWSDFWASHHYEAAAEVDLAIEVVFEDIHAKRDVFAQLVKVMRRDAILATNTSYLNPDEIFFNLENPQRCVGIHFFAPAHIMKLVEVIKAKQTSPKTLATAFALANKLRKTPVLSGICDGFIGNRILTAYRRAAEYLLADGALPEQVDKAMRAFGMAMGPFEAQDMSGLHIAEANRRRHDATRNPNERYVPISDHLCAAGRFGQRTGRGWYQYKPQSREPIPDPDVESMILDYAAKANIRRIDFCDSDIQSILLAAMANEGARIIDEGIADNEAAVDVVKIAGYGFPRWKGGPMHWANTANHADITAVFNSLISASPNAWILANRFQSIS